MMQRLHLTHIVFASLLWCACVFAFIGMTFLMFEATEQSFKDERVEMTLSKIQQEVHLEMDKGRSLALLQDVSKSLLEYQKQSKDMLSLFLFDSKTGKVLHSTNSKRIGSLVPLNWQNECVNQGVFFMEKQFDVETIGLPVFNSFLKTTGCLVAQFDLKVQEKHRKKMINTTFHYTVRLSFLGVLGCFLFYLYYLISERNLFQSKAKRICLFAFVFCVLGYSVPVNILGMFNSFEKDLSVETTAKSKMLANIIKKEVETAVSNGASIKDIYEMVPYLNQIRKDNKGILFILITDKTGRVLYESGSANQAFDTDPYTGKISLKEGYSNIAESIMVQKEILGWVQLGINERFVREEIF